MATGEEKKELCEKMKKKPEKRGGKARNPRLSRAMSEDDPGLRRVSDSYDIPPCMTRSFEEPSSGYNSFPEGEDEESLLGTTVDAVHPRFAHPRKHRPISWASLPEQEAPLIQETKQVDEKAPGTPDQVVKAQNGLKCIRCDFSCETMAELKAHWLRMPHICPKCGLALHNIHPQQGHITEQEHKCTPGFTCMKGCSDGKKLSLFEMLRHCSQSRHGSSGFCAVCNGNIFRVLIPDGNVKSICGCQVEEQKQAQ